MYPFYVQTLQNDLLCSIITFTSVLSNLGGKAYNQLNCMIYLFTTKASINLNYINIDLCFQNAPSAISTIKRAIKSQRLIFKTFDKRALNSLQIYDCQKLLYHFERQMRTRSVPSFI